MLGICWRIQFKDHQTQPGNINPTSIKISGTKSASQTKSTFVPMDQPWCEAVQLHSALRPTNLDAALGKSQLPASKSKPYPIWIRKQVKEIRGPEKYFHNLSIPFTRSVPLHSSQHQDCHSTVGRGPSCLAPSSQEPAAPDIAGEGYQKPCKKQFCVLCCQRNLASYHCQNTWSGFGFCFWNIFLFLWIFLLAI